MKDVQGHGSNGRGGASALSGAAKFSHDLTYAAHQAATLAAVPSVAGANLYRDLMAHGERGAGSTLHSGFSDSDLRGLAYG